MNSLKSKFILLLIIVLLGLNFNYQLSFSEENGKIFFTDFQTIRISFLSLYVADKNGQNWFFDRQEKNFIWGYPFGYLKMGDFAPGSGYKFYFHFFIYNLIIYLIFWLIVLGLIWFIKGVKKIKSRTKEIEKKLQL